MPLSSKDRARFAAYSAPFKVVNGRKFRLRDFDPGDTLHLESSDKPHAQEGLGAASSVLRHCRTGSTRRTAGRCC